MLEKLVGWRLRSDAHDELVSASIAPWGWLLKELLQGAASLELEDTEHWQDQEEADGQREFLCKFQVRGNLCLFLLRGLRGRPELAHVQGKAFIHSRWLPEASLAGGIHQRKIDRFLRK